MSMQPGYQISEERVYHQRMRERERERKREREEGTLRD